MKVLSSFFVMEHLFPRDGMSKLTNFSLRYIPQFSQPDSDVPENQGVQGFDRDAYVNNSPINYNDPTVHDWEQIIYT